MQLKRETKKIEKHKTAEEELKEVKKELAGVKLVLDDIILNGGA